MDQKHSLPVWFQRVDSGIMKFVKGISMLGMAALFVIALISTVNVVAAKLFSHPIRNVVELVTYLNIPVVFFCIGFVQLDRGHTHIDLIYRHLPPVFHTAIHILGDLIGIAVCGFAGFRGLVLAMNKLQSAAYASGPSSFRIWPFVLCIGIGYLILAVSFLWSIFKELYNVGPYEIDYGGNTGEER